MTQFSPDDHLALINLVLLCHLRRRRRLQDAADHVNAQRIPGMVISVYARQGAVIHTRYDLSSVVRSINDELATPMYDAFTAKTLSTVPVA